MLYVLLVPFILSLLMASSIFWIIVLVLRYVPEPKKWQMAELSKPGKVLVWPKLFVQPSTGFQYVLFWSGLYLPFNVRILLSAGVVIALSSVMLGSILPVLFGVCIAVACVTTIVVVANRRRNRFILQLPSALSVLVQSLGAGFLLPDAFALLGRELPAPSGQVFGMIKNAWDLGVPIHQSITQVSRILRVSEWDLVTESFYVHGVVGGNIVPVLQEVAQTLLDKQNADRDIKTHTAAGRLSGIVIALLAPLSLLVFWIFSPDYVSVFFTEPQGKLLLSLAAILEIAGFAVVWRITKVDY